MVQGDNISANYLDGVLKITIPKNKNNDSESIKQIEIS
jgi:HSP20 family molecular chaperone IbpA